MLVLWQEMKLFAKRHENFVFSATILFIALLSFALHLYGLDILQFVIAGESNVPNPLLYTFLNTSLLFLVILMALAVFFLLQTLFAICKDKIVKFIEVEKEYWSNRSKDKQKLIK